MELSTALALALALVGLCGSLWVCATRIGYRFRRSSEGLKLPPGPRGLPILGHLVPFLVSKHLPKDLLRMSTNFGHIMSIKLGPRRAIVVSSGELANVILKHQDAIFANRSPTYASSMLRYGFKDIAFAPYGAHHRQARKTLTSELLGNAKLPLFENDRLLEVRSMVNAVRRHIGQTEPGQTPQPLDLCAMFRTLMLNNITRISLNRPLLPYDNIVATDPRNGRHSEHNSAAGKFHHLLEVHLEYIGIQMLSDYVPWLSLVDRLSGTTAALQNIRDKFDRYMEETILHDPRHRQLAPGSPRSYIDALISVHGEFEDEKAQSSNTRVKAQMLNTLVAGTEPSSTILIWAFSEMLRRPDVLRKAQEEVDRVVGQERAVRESDLGQLPYIEAVVKEALRMYPIAPLLISHCAMEDTKVAGFDVPANTIAIVNAWAVGRDPAVWAEPHQFQPERFLQGPGAQVDVRGLGKGLEVCAFGAGRRGCPGAAMALITIPLAIATLLHAVAWSLPADIKRPQDLDMSENLKLTLARATPLRAVPALRSHSHLYAWPVGTM